MKPKENLKKKPYGPLSLLDLQKKFPNEKSCWNYFVKLRWPDGFICPSCQHTKGCFKAPRKVFECYGCKRQVSVTAGTIFHKSRVPLKKWFWCIFFMATSKKGVSMLYLQRQLGIGSYRTVWLMGHKVRKAMAARDAGYTLSGVVQADEIFIGGKQSRKNSRKSASNKTQFMIAVKEKDDGKPRFMTFKELESLIGAEVSFAVEEKIKKGSTLKSDGAGAYKWAAKMLGYKLKRSVYQKDPGKTSEHLKWVNTLTGNLKRFLLSTHHGVFPKYRTAYLSEFAYRFNRRFWPEQAFDRLLYACIHDRPTSLRELTA